MKYFFSTDIHKNVMGRGRERPSRWSVLRSRARERAWSWRAAAWWGCCSCVWRWKKMGASEASWPACPKRRGTEAWRCLGGPRDALAAGVFVSDGFRFGTMKPQEYKITTIVVRDGIQGRVWGRAHGLCEERLGCGTTAHDACRMRDMQHNHTLHKRQQAMQKCWWCMTQIRKNNQARTIINPHRMFCWVDVQAGLAPRSAIRQRAVGILLCCCSLAVLSSILYATSTKPLLTILFFFFLFRSPPVDCTSSAKLLQQCSYPAPVTNNSQRCGWFLTTREKKNRFRRGRWRLCLCFCRVNMCDMTGVKCVS